MKKLCLFTVSILLLVVASCQLDQEKEIVVDQIENGGNADEVDRLPEAFAFKEIRINDSQVLYQLTYVSDSLTYYRLLAVADIDGSEVVVNNF